MKHRMDAAKKALKPKSKLVGTTPIQSMIKQVVSFKALPDCSSAGCKHKAKFGYEAPALACSAHKVEGMHEISIAKMNLEPTELISAASIIASPPEILPSARVGEMNESTASRVSSKDTQSATTSDVLVDDIYHSGMQLNPHWIENNCQKPKWRSYHSLKKHHPVPLKHFHFNLDLGGMVICKDCCSFPGISDSKCVFVTGYFGMKSSGYKWEVFC